MGLGQRQAGKARPAVGIVWGIIVGYVALREICVCHQLQGSVFEAVRAVGRRVHMLKD